MIFADGHGPFLLVPQIFVPHAWQDFEVLVYVEQRFPLL